MRWKRRVALYAMVVVVGLAYVGSSHAVAGAVASAVKAAGKAGLEVLEAASKLASKLGSLAVSAARVGVRVGGQIADDVSRFGLRLFNKVDDLAATAAGKIDDLASVAARAADKARGLPRRFAKFVASKAQFSGKSGMDVLQSVGNTWEKFEKVMQIYAPLTKTESSVEGVRTERYRATGILDDALSKPKKKKAQRLMPEADVLEVKEVASVAAIKDEAAPKVSATGLGLGAALAGPPAAAGLAGALGGALPSVVAELPAVPVQFGENLVYDPSRQNKVFDAKTGQDIGVVYVDGQILSAKQTAIYVPRLKKMVAIPKKTKPVPGYPGYVYHVEWDGEIYDPKTFDYTKKVYRNGMIMSPDESKIYDPQTDQWRPNTGEGATASDLPALPSVFGEGLVYDATQGNKVIDTKTGQGAGGVYVDGQILSAKRTHLFVPRLNTMVAIPKKTKPVPGYPGYVYHVEWDGEIYDPKTLKYAEKVYRNGTIMSPDEKRIYDPQTDQWRPKVGQEPQQKATDADGPAAGASAGASESAAK